MITKLAVRGLRFRYQDREIFDALSFSVGQGEYVALVGASGTGKSTLLNLLMGVIERDAGEIEVDATPILRGADHFAYMPQDDLLLPWLTVLENVCLYGDIHAKRDEARARALMPVFGLAGYEDAYPNRLSGGMRQRAAFLRTALCDREILLLDEPFGALDVITRGDMQDWLLSMRAAINQTALLVTHDIDEAIYLADRVLVIGGSPARLTHEFRIESEARTREWLLSQAGLRAEIHRAVKEYM